MNQEPEASSRQPIKPRLLPGQTVMFLGDHTSPDKPGYVRVVGEVLSRFWPELRPNLSSAGSPGQTAAGLASRQLLDLITSSRPDWLSISLGLSDAQREPALIGLMHEYRAWLAQADTDLETAIGPEYRVSKSYFGAPQDSGTPVRQPVEWQRLPIVRDKIKEALDALRSAGVQPLLHSTIAVGNDLSYPLNGALKAYSRAIREICEQEMVPLVEDERAFRDVLDRATTYKQRVALASEQGEVNAQGEALLARTFLHTFGLLPQPGQRPLR